VFGKFVPFIQSGDPLPVKLVIEAAHHIERYNEDYLAAADEIMPEASKYLQPVEIRALVRADLSDKDVLLIVSNRKSLYDRFCFLFPRIACLLDYFDSDNIRISFHKIFDFCIDFSLHENAPQRRVLLRKSQRDITGCKQKIDDIIKSIDLIHWSVGIEFSQHKTLIHQGGSDFLPVSDLDQMKGELEELSFAMDVARYRVTVDEEARFFPSSKVRHATVELAYELSLRNEQSKFVTTPGSDFSELCSLIFELAGGVAHEGLSGTISRFARSNERQRIEQNEARANKELEEYNGARPVDNFEWIIEEMESAKEDLEFWTSFKNSQNWPAKDLVRIGRHIGEAMGRFNELYAKHGPFVVWIDQLSEQDRHDMSERHKRDMDRILELEGKRFALDREIGNLRRAGIDTSGLGF
jgi:hypothetical protein